MSDKVFKMVKMGAIASLDLTAGAGCAFVINKIFEKDSSDFTLGELALRVVSRAFLTVWMGEEVRSLMYPFDLEDPTNAALFIGGLLASQPQLHRDTRTLIATALNKVMSLPVFGFIPTGATAEDKSASVSSDKPADSKLGQITNNAIDTMERWAGTGS